MRRESDYTVGRVTSLFRAHRGVIRIFAMTASLFLTGSGCCKTFDAETAKGNDAAREWLRDWPGKYDWVEEKLRWKNVAKAKMPQAELLLRETASVRITGEQARDLIGQSSSPGWTGTPYLLRAVGDAPGKWPQEVFVRPSGEVWVGGGANSRCPVPKQRRAVVAWLDQSPRDVYVTFIVGK